MSIHSNQANRDADSPFVWGAATAAYQIEGGAKEGGKGPSIWDAHCQIPGHIANGESGETACDHYHLFEKDIDHMAELGVNAYRFSIAWSRIVPDGEGKANPEGLAFYNRLIDGLIAKGIKPFVTLYHWDLPLSLQLKHDGWLNRFTAECFSRYAEICFEAFGDRVRHWITFNENWCTAILGHGSGIFAPGRVSNSEPYQAGHNLLLAHGMAVKVFRENGHEGVIGIANNSDWREPLTDSEDDASAAQEALEFFYGWFTDPVVFGDYPAVMKQRLGDRLPVFSPDEKKMLKGSVDFLGLNHYTSHYASRKPVDENITTAEDGNGGIDDDQHVHLSHNPEWPRTSMGWFVVPRGFRRMLNWIDQRYSGLPVYVTENGCSVAADTREDAVNDQFRADFIRDYVAAMEKAVFEDGVNCQGYFLWSLMDNFEWCRGYEMRFGLIYVDFKTMERTPKASFNAYREIIQNSSLSKTYEERP